MLEAFPTRVRHVHDSCEHAPVIFRVTLAIIAVGLLSLSLGVALDPVELAHLKAFAQDAPLLEQVVVSTGLSALGETAFAARIGHVVMALVTVLAIASAPRSRRAGLFAVAALLGSPAFVLGARSAAPGVIAILPLVIATFAILDHAERPRRITLGVLVAASVLVVVALGIPGIAIELVVALALRRGRAVLAIALVGVIAFVVAELAGASLAPAAKTDARAFADALGNLGLGAFPLVLVTLVGVVRMEAMSTTTRAHLACAAACTCALLVWPSDPYLFFATLGPLAMLAGDTLDDLAASDDRRTALACVIAIATTIVARCFDLEPARLVGAHVGAGVDATPTTLGYAGIACMAVFAAALVVALVTRWRRIAIAVALVGAIGLSADTSLRRARAVSMYASIEPLLERAGRFAITVDASIGVETRFASRRLSKVTAADLAKRLAPGVCNGAIVALSELPALERVARGTYVVVGDAHAGAHLVSSCLPHGETDQNPLAKTLLDRLPSPLPGLPRDAVWANAVRLRAAEIPVRAKSKDKITITLVLEVIAAIPPPARSITLRLEDGGFLVWADHVAAKGALPLSVLRPGDIVVDRHEVEVGEWREPAVLAVTVGLGRFNKPLPIEPTTDESERFTLGAVIVEPATR